MSRAQQASDRAARFIIAQEDGDWSAADQAELDLWLAEADGNKAAYWRLKHSWRQADRIGALGRSKSAANDRSLYRSVQRWFVPGAIAASITLVAAASYMAWRPSSAPSTQVATAAFRTPIGERKTIGFPDGSRVQLNTASAVRATVTARRRDVWLDQGEAFFEVAHRDGQPFVVHAGNRQITVLGTKFSVRRDGGKVTVAVLEGRVRVDELGDTRAMRSSVIVGGDIALAEGAATLVTTRSKESVQNALAWRNGMLNFDQTSLNDVAAEFNRYNKRQMVMVGADVGSIRIGGMFPATDPEAFARLLRDAYGLKVEETPTVVKISN